MGSSVSNTSNTQYYRQQERQEGKLREQLKRKDTEIGNLIRCNITNVWRVVYQMERNFQTKELSDYNEVLICYKSSKVTLKQLTLIEKLRFSLKLENPSYFVALALFLLFVGHTLKTSLLIRLPISMRSFHYNQTQTPPNMNQ